MQVCKECKSDVVERTSSTAGRVVVCIILLFIPFGFLVCWVPFVFAHTYKCKNCGLEGKEDMLMDLDWREKDLMLDINNTSDSMQPYIGKWLHNNFEAYKLVSHKHQILLLSPTLEGIVPYKLIRCSNDEASTTLHIKKLVSELGSLSEFLMSRDELEEFNNNDYNGFIKWVEDNYEVVEDFNITIIE